MNENMPLGNVGEARVQCERARGRPKEFSNDMMARIKLRSLNTVNEAKII